MTARSIRRAAERKANKLTRKAAQQLTPADHVTTETEFPPEPIEESETPAVIPAAAANANLSAITSALTGQAALLPMAEAAQYNQLLRDYQTELQPVGLQEFNLVQTLAETVWRTRRLVALESTIFAKGHIEFAKQFAEHKPELRDALIDVHTFLTYEKQIRALQLQEARLTRRADKASAELRMPQKERHQREEQARRLHTTQPVQNGSVFANRQIDPLIAPKDPGKANSAAAETVFERAEAA